MINIEHRERIEGLTTVGIFYNDDTPFTNEKREV